MRILAYLLLLTLGCSASAGTPEAKAKRELKNVQEIDESKFVPQVDPNTGRIDGFKAVEVKKGSPFEEAGIKKGTIVTGINGKKIDDDSQDLELFKNLKVGDRLEFKNQEAKGE